MRKDLISIIEIKKKSKVFHSRFDAKERIYEYKIINREGALSLNNNKAWHIKNRLNLDFLKKGAKLLEGTHDFSTFRAASCTSTSPIKKNEFCKSKKKRDFDFY